MAGGILQPRPAEDLDTFSTSPEDFAVSFLPSPGDAAPLPKLIVFDLDNTLWTPELYTLRSLPGYRDASGPGPMAGRDVWLLSGASQALFELVNCERWAETELAVASRTNKGRWAHKLMRSFSVPVREGKGIVSRLDPSQKEGGRVSLDSLAVQKEIFPTNKVRHLQNLREATGIEFRDMLFFDDADGGKYGNCVPVSGLGVMSVYCPKGLTQREWRRGVKSFVERRAEPGRENRMGVVLRPPKVKKDKQSAARVQIVKMFPEKGFGFVEIIGEADSAPSESRNVFFHVSALEEGSGDLSTLRVGETVVVSLEKGRDGRERCGLVRRSSTGISETQSIPSTGNGVQKALGQTVTLPCFSMNQPFASLLAHGCKTVETRNWPMFESVRPGTHMLLHVGHKTFPDGGKHRKILQSRGYSDKEVQRLTEFPAPGESPDSNQSVGKLNFTRGAVVAIVEVGETVLVESVEKRSEKEVVEAVIAFGEDMGKYATQIRRVAWLKEGGFRIRGQKGVFSVEIPKAKLPDDWIIGY
uniref:CSD domain-containing protein n=1 Tax=Chromera velia CCMP2878 TaxID=1169474 RepID=A0A0G4GFC1_9ALVE|eukprot:Cvel_21629.t1-p1 / transcript=Cvel_21629.t1 / gene=Cvel_21629 / organism=Chromera_velia_CCMP2878 / gene_product=Magnesium-dependent phosphatase 1, putative / transcript_product=Magnesium-dependent phosphatase 1, putative / location=Cvel_scaffold2045:3542-5122(-) / protein_length=527 / sequence_SO=supercontig / SO=protein_coding / is_pseudo=false